MFIAACGYCNLDLLYSGMPRVPLEGEEIYSKAFDVQLGGGAPATMINLARLGVPTRLSTFLGTDMFSGFLKGEFKKYNVDFQNLYQGDGIPLAITSAAITPRDRAFISYRDNPVIDDAMREAVYQSAKGGKITEMHEGFLEVYKKLKKEGTILVFDLGWDDDMSMEKYADYIELADYYTPNQKEALKITGTSTPEDALTVLAKHFKKAIVKLDKDGCLIEEAGKRSLLPIMPGVKAVDSTGAGDAFMAGLLYGVFHDFSFTDSVLCGNITGGTCVQGVGCLSRYVNEAELLAKLKEMQRLVK